jgi:RNA polymerase sigma factor (sigma-70 family)
MATRSKAMPTSPLSVVLQHLLADLRLEGDGMTDGELLARFLRSRDEDALAALVRRHASMVWGVCRRLLNHHDAEDAFQATFLVLVRKTADVPGQAVANWLYGVARQTAVRLRATAAKRGRRERQVVNMPEPTVAEVRDADLQRVVDEELSRLPDHYRGVVVLCDLEGMTRKEAARQLAIPEGSVASRLARARALLAKRLAHRGIVFSGGSVAAVLSAGPAWCAPPAVVAATIKAASLVAAGQAAGVVSAKVAALTQGVVNTMLVTKIKSLLAVALVVAALAGAAGLLYTTQAADQPKANAEQPAAKKGQKKGEEKQPMTKEDKLRVLIDKVLAAHGGEDKLKKLQFTMTIKHSNAYINRYFVQPPKNFRWERTHRDQTSKMIVILFPEGRRWWTKEPNEEPKEFIPSGVEPTMVFWLDYVKFFGPRQVLRLKDADHKVALLDDEAKIGDRAAVGVQVTGPHYNHKMYFDKQTHLLLKGVGSDILGEVTFSDYKMFDGIPIAQKEHDRYYEPEVTDFRAVDKLDPKLFEQP